MEISHKIACYAYETKGDWNQIAEKIKSNALCIPYDISEPYITIMDDNYPNSLRSLRYPPWIIFYRGDISILNQVAVSVVGSRITSSYGEKCTLDVCHKLSQHYVLVSGLARGIDTIVHQVGIQKGKTIAVLGCGLDLCYPQSNQGLFDEIKRNHLVISEYPKGVKAQKHHFPWRNRLIAALGQFCVVTQATYRSGTMLTVNEALELSKDVYCIPYPLGDPCGNGCNLLIQQGAFILLENESFLW